jgi:hypothetical protein
MGGMNRLENMFWIIFLKDWIIQNFEGMWTNNKINQLREIQERKKKRGL